MADRIYQDDFDPIVIREHERTRDFFRETFKGFDSPDQKRALTAVVGALRLLASSLWDGAQVLSPERRFQAQIDATVMTDLGSAINDVINP